MEDKLEEIKAHCWLIDQAKIAYEHLTDENFDLVSQWFFHKTLGMFNTEDSCLNYLENFIRKQGFYDRLYNKNKEKQEFTAVILPFRPRKERN